MSEEFNGFGFNASAGEDDANNAPPKEKYYLCRKGKVKRIENGIANIVFSHMDFLELDDSLNPTDPHLSDIWKKKKGWRGKKCDTNIEIKQKLDMKRIFDPWEMNFLRLGFDSVSVCGFLKTNPLNIKFNNLKVAVDFYNPKMVILHENGFGQITPLTWDFNTCYAKQENLAEWFRGNRTVGIVGGSRKRRRNKIKSNKKNSLPKRNRTPKKNKNKFSKKKCAK
jgi:hypothetical protein